jgi:hypothetical protein
MCCQIGKIDADELTDICDNLIDADLEELIDCVELKTYPGAPLVTTGKVPSAEFPMNAYLLTRGWQAMHIHRHTLHDHFLPIKAFSHVRVH